MGVIISVVYWPYILLGITLAALGLLVIPVSLEYDSTTGRLRLKWLGLTIIRRPKAGKSRKPPEAAKKNWPRAALRPLWQKRDLVLELFGQMEHFVLEIYRTLSFQDSAIEISLPDPMWNGLLYAALTNIQLDELNLAVNFESRNYARLAVTVFPYRLLPKLAVLLIRLPYIRLLRLAWELKQYRQPV